MSWTPHSWKLFGVALIWRQIAQLAVPRDLKTAAKLDAEAHMEELSVVTLFNKTIVPGMNFVCVKNP